MEKKSTFMPSFQFGILTGLAMIIFTLIIYLLGVKQQSYWGIVNYLIFIIGIYWAMVNVRDKYLDGTLSYGKAFGSGFWVSLWAAILLGIFAFFYLKYINTGVLENAVSQAQEKMLAANPDISDEQLDKSLAMVKMFARPGISAIMQFISNIILGTLFSLIIAIFAKREDKSIA